MSQVGPAFVTHHEIEAFLGGGASAKRQRQRLQDGRRLPEPHWLPRVDRFRTGVYPIFALAGLLDDLAHVPEAGRQISTLSTKVFGSAAFRDLSEALVEAVRTAIAGPAAWRFDQALEQLAGSAGPALLAWGAVVADAHAQLETWGVRLSEEYGSVEGRAGGVYVVALEQRTDRFPALRVAAPLEQGRAVAVEHVSVIGSALDFVMPAVEIEQAPTDAEELDWSEVSDADWSAALSRARAHEGELSFDRGYWREDEPAELERGPFAAIDATSGRRAAADLLAASS